MRWEIVLVDGTCWKQEAGRLYVNQAGCLLFTNREGTRSVLVRGYSPGEWKQVQVVEEPDT